MQSNLFCQSVVYGTGYGFQLYFKCVSIGLLILYQWEIHKMKYKTFTSIQTAQYRKTSVTIQKVVIWSFLNMTHFYYFFELRIELAAGMKENLYQLLLTLGNPVWSPDRVALSLGSLHVPPLVWMGFLSGAPIPPLTQTMHIRLKPYRLQHGDTSPDVALKDGLNGEYKFCCTTV